MGSSKGLADTVTVAIAQDILAAKLYTEYRQADVLACSAKVALLLCKVKQPLSMRYLPSIYNSPHSTLTP